MSKGSDLSEEEPGCSSCCGCCTVIAGLLLTPLIAMFVLYGSGPPSDEVLATGMVVVFSVEVMWAVIGCLVVRRIPDRKPPPIRKRGPKPFKQPPELSHMPPDFKILDDGKIVGYYHDDIFWDSRNKKSVGIIDIKDPERIELKEKDGISLLEMHGRMIRYSEEVEDLGFVQDLKVYHFIIEVSELAYELIVNEDNTKGDIMRDEQVIGSIEGNMAAMDDIRFVAVLTIFFELFA